MGKAGVNWDSTETWQRLVASIIASGVKLDLRVVALHFGTTYDTLENRFRKIKKDAAVQKQEIESGVRGEVASVRKSNASTPRKPRSPKTTHALETVANGRVTKSTPSKKHSVKQEHFEPDFSFLTEDFTDPQSFDDTPISFDMSNYENSFIHGSMLGQEDAF
ncbi:hypothetical protein AMS68_004001 [Peltaster fructicola]|uniref:Myb-like domain-containing protein n=1 Tax=Peltaster fructicola TaxID=286661 RepID=A0A6H0XUS6_9PEZI|nr:hypothetical protein AMS68_004001 [Peltaster fructicola]